LGWDFELGGFDWDFGRGGPPARERWVISVFNTSRSLDTSECLLRWRSVLGSECHVML